MYSFTGLEFYQLARVLAVDCVKIARRFPRDDVIRTITRQFVGSSTSIRANIAEGHGRYSKAAYRNHLSIARGSAAETQDWLDLLGSLDLICDEEQRQLTDRCQTIIAALTRAMKRLAPTADPPRTSEPQSVYVLAEEDPAGNPDDDIDDDAPMPTSSNAQESVKELRNDD